MQLPNQVRVMYTVITVCIDANSKNACATIKAFLIEIGGNDKKPLSKIIYSKSVI